MCPRELRRSVAALAASLALVGWWPCAPAPAQPRDSSARALKLDQLGELHRLIKPGPHEAKWEQVPWMPSSDIWAARQKAAAEGKPVFLWYMAGEPLGTC